MYKLKLKNYTFIARAIGDMQSLLNRASLSETKKKECYIFGRSFEIERISYRPSTLPLPNSSEGIT